MANNYDRMVLEAHDVSILINCAAALAAWLLLAGLITYSGTYVSLAGLEAGLDALDEPEAHDAVTTVIQNVPLVWIATLCCILGLAGMAYLWWMQRTQYNHVWLMDKIFIPGLVNAGTGLVTTVLNVQTAQDRTWSTTAVSTGILSLVLFILMGVAITVHLWLLLRLRGRI